MEKAIVDALGVIADHIVASLSNKVGEGFQDLKKTLSGKKIIITIEIPDLTT